jgi:hypothetical protein
MATDLLVQTPKAQWVLRVGLLLSALIGAGALWQFQAQIAAEGLLETSTNFRGALYGGGVLVAALALLAGLAWTPAAGRVLIFFSGLQNGLRRLGPFALGLFVLLLFAFPFVVLGFYGRFLLEIFPRLFFFWCFTALGAAFLAAGRKTAWATNLPAALLAMAAVFLATTFFFQAQDYPFSLEWSEVSRYYQASFYFSQQVYGVDLPLPITHPSRYLLQSLPFLISDLPLWLHRFWQALLWVGMPLLTAWVLARRLRVKPGSVFLMLVAWVYLFLMQGAVFYHLLPCVFLVLLGFDKDQPWRSLLFVALASMWAGISRINWVPLPGALAALLYLLEARPARGRAALSFGYLWPPALYAIGGSLLALGAYGLYILNSGNPDPSQFGSPFTSALLWERLWPNAAFPLGILPGILLVSAPLFTLAWLRLRQKGFDLGVWRSLGAAALLVIFFAGGLVVSVKIGGGTNLHNMDAYLVLLLVTTSVLVFGAYAPESNKKAVLQLKISTPLLIALLAVPIGFAVLSGGPLEIPTRPVAADVLTQIQSTADEVLLDGGEVLFISQRHLLTFHLVKGVPLVHEYEKLFLMEMAISHNDDYLSDFSKDIDQHRFDLIVTDPLYNNILTVSQDPLAPENNAWVRNVGRPLLCAYEVVTTFDDPAIQLLTPRYGDKCDQ